MLGVLTTIIGTVARGKAAKAIAGGTATTLVTIGGPVVEMLQKGFIEGVGPSIEQIGVIAGQGLGAFLVGYAMTWLAPKNAVVK